MWGKKRKSIIAGSLAIHNLAMPTQTLYPFHHACTLDKISIDIVKSTPCLLYDPAKIHAIIYKARSSEDARSEGGWEAATSFSPRPPISGFPRPDGQLGPGMVVNMRG